MNQEMLQGRKHIKPLQSIEFQLHLAQSLCKTPLAELPGVHETLFREVDVLHVGGIGGRRAADTRSDHDGVGLENNAVIDSLVNGKGNKIVVLDDGALVGCAPDSYG